MKNSTPINHGMVLKDILPMQNLMTVNIHEKEPLLFIKSIPAKIKKIIYNFHNFLF
jgi:hypothetical protein